MGLTPLKVMAVPVVLPVVLVEAVLDRIQRRSLENARQADEHEPPPEQLLYEAALIVNRVKNPEGVGPGEVVAHFYPGAIP